MKIIKINEEHYVIVNDSQIKKGDWVFNEKSKEIYMIFVIEEVVHYEKKITHSTQPLELLSENGLSGMGFSKIRPLNVFEVKELIGEVDVEKKAREEHEQALKRGGSEYAAGYYEGLLDGYNQALEDNKEKKYTEEDILMLLQKIARKYFQEGREYKGNMAIAGDPLHGLRSELKELIQPKTEWEVEIVDDKLKLK